MSVKESEKKNKIAFPFGVLISIDLLKTISEESIQESIDKGYRHVKKMIEQRKLPKDTEIKRKEYYFGGDKKIKLFVYAPEYKPVNVLNIIL